MLDRRGFNIGECSGKFFGREAGGRVQTNVFVRGMDLDVPVAGGRRLEVVVDGLPLQGGAQLAVDTTMVCAGTPRQGKTKNDGVALKARRKKATAYPELVGPHYRAKLVVMAAEVGGRLSEEPRAFLSQLSRALSRSDMPLMCHKAEQPWSLRWGAMLACTSAKAVASSLLDLLDCHGGDGKMPLTHEVDSDHRHAGLTAQVVWCGFQF